MKNVVVFGEIFSPNIGDGVIYNSLEYLFSLKNIKTSPSDLSGLKQWENNTEETTPKPINILHKSLRIPIRKIKFLRRIYSALNWFIFKRKKISPIWEDIIASSDGVIIGGGQLLTDINFGFTPKIYEISRLAKKHKKPLAFFGCGVGSNGWGLLSRYMYGAALHYAKYVSCRDESSAKIIKGYFPNFNVYVHPDPDFIISYLLKEKNSKKTINPTSIGFNFQDANHFRNFVPNLKKLTDEEYIRFWVSIISSAYNSGYQVSIFSNGDPEDYKFAKAVHFKLKNLGYNITLYPRPLKPVELIKIINNFANVIATRMHAGIISYALGNQPLAISWDKKVDGVWNSLGLGEFVVSEKIFDSIDPWLILEEKLTSIKKNPIKDNNIENINNILLNEINNCCTKLDLRDYS